MAINEKDSALWNAIKRLGIARRGKAAPAMIERLERRVEEESNAVLERLGVMTQEDFDRVVTQAAGADLKLLQEERAKMPANIGTMRLQVMKSMGIPLHYLTGDHTSGHEAKKAEYDKRGEVGRAETSEGTVP